MTPQPILNKWQIIATFGRHWATMERGWKLVAFGLIKLHHLPREGEIYHKSHYRGFICRFFIWLPIDLP